jgi:hypothetical protein
MLGCVRQAREGTVMREDFRCLAASPSLLEPEGDRMQQTEFIGGRVWGELDTSSQTSDGERNWGTRVLDVPLAGG